MHDGVCRLGLQITLAHPIQADKDITMEVRGSMFAPLLQSTATCVCCTLLWPAVLCWHRFLRTRHGDDAECVPVCVRVFSEVGLAN